MGFRTTLAHRAAGTGIPFPAVEMGFPAFPVSISGGTAAAHQWSQGCALDCRTAETLRACMQGLEATLLCPGAWKLSSTATWINIKNNREAQGRPNDQSMTRSCQHGSSSWEKAMGVAGVSLLLCDSATSPISGVSGFLPLLVLVLLSTCSSQTSPWDLLTFCCLFKCLFSVVVGLVSVLRWVFSPQQEFPPQLPPQYPFSLASFEEG